MSRDPGGQKSKSARVVLASLPAKVPLRRTFFVRYGPIALSKHFDLGYQLDVVLRASSGVADLLGLSLDGVFEKLKRRCQRDGIDVLVEVGKVVDAIRMAERGGGDTARDRVVRSYYEFLGARGVPPTFEELRRRVWEIDAAPKVRVDLGANVDGQTLRSELTAIFKEGKTRKGVCEPPEIKDFRRLIAPLQLPLLDGNLLRKARLEFARAKEKLGHPPCIAEFTNEVIAKGLFDPGPIQGQSVDAFLEFLGDPIGGVGCFSWTDGVIDIWRQSVSGSEVPGAPALLDGLIFLGIRWNILNVEPCLVSMVEESDPDVEFLNGEFLRMASAQGGLPGFAEFWFGGEGSSTPLDRAGVAPGNLDLLQRMGGAYRKARRGGSNEVTMGLIGATVPEVAEVCRCLERYFRRFPATKFWQAVQAGE